MSRAAPMSAMPSTPGAIMNGLASLVAAVLQPCRAIVQRRALAALSDRQLHDAGIDLSLAGRGRAAVASSATLRNLPGLS
jgi:uncharacterized protein YjiS (DUF1127 family)